jgi:hypothetical protein
MYYPGVVLPQHQYLVASKEENNTIRANKVKEHVIVIRYANYTLKMYLD